MAVRVTPPRSSGEAGSPAASRSPRRGPSTSIGHGHPERHRGDGPRAERPNPSPVRARWRSARCRSTAVVPLTWSSRGACTVAPPKARDGAPRSATAALAGRRRRRTRPGRGAHGGVDPVRASRRRTGADRSSKPRSESPRAISPRSCWPVRSRRIRPPARRSAAARPAERALPGIVVLRRRRLRRREPRSCWCRGSATSFEPSRWRAPRPAPATPTPISAGPAELLGSSKNREEHQITIDMVHDTLLPWCSYLDAEPSRRSSPPVRSSTSRPSSRAGCRSRLPPVLDLVAALHPTPAVGGWPRGRGARADRRARRRRPWSLRGTGRLDRRSGQRRVRRRHPIGPARGNARPALRRRRRRGRLGPVGRARRDPGQGPGPAGCPGPSVVPPDAGLRSRPRSSPMPTPRGPGRARPPPRRTRRSGPHRHGPGARPAAGAPPGGGRGSGGRWRPPGPCHTITGTSPRRAGSPSGGRTAPGRGRWHAGRRR